MKRENRPNEIFDVIIAKSIPKLMRDTKPQIQEAQRKTRKKNTEM